MEERSGKKSRLFTVLACVVIAAGVALVTIAMVRVQQSVLREERNQMLVIARSTAKSVDNYLQGSQTGIELAQMSPSFMQAVDTFRQYGDKRALLRHLAFLNSDKLPAVRDVFYLAGNGETRAGTTEADAYELLTPASADPTDGKMRVFRGRSGQVFLGIVTRIDADGFLLSLLDVERLYEKTASFVTLREKGYIMYKHSGGIILTHPVREQIGHDVLEGRKKTYPALDYGELEQLVANQEKGLEALEVYHSYWWAESPPPRVKKISAYTPVHVQNDFLIISAVTDYEELLAPIQVSSAVLILAAVLVFLGVSALLYRNRRENQRKITRENEYLKQLNRSLDEMARRQEEMRHDQRLQIIGTLTGGIAHEFRNLLTPIMGYSGLLRESLPPDSSLREDIEEIYGSAVKAKEIIQQITALSRRNLKLEFRPLRLEKVLPGILKIAASSKPADYQIDTNLDFDGEYVLGDKTQISQIVLNLCNNAFQAKKSGKGHLWIAGDVVRENGERFLRLRFRDDGAGIEPELLQRIFDPFFTTKRVGEGTGLGLSVVQNIVELHNGKIEVYSELGVGTAFTLRLPVIDPVERGMAAEDRPAARPVEEPLGIVLVEDEAQVAKILQRGLEKSGFTVTAFPDPIAALRHLEKNACQLLITDYSMPGMNGIELATLVRERDRKVKILILTGFADKDLQDYLRLEIIDGYQIKPVPISELVEKIDALFA